jgi:citrate lyase subunit beta/citryl-CoA lyase
VLISRLAGLDPPVDGIQTAIDNPEELREQAQRARRLGFGGKLCIHPKQVALVNECFLPAAEEVAWACRVVEAADAAQGSAVRLDGQMIDRPVVLKAERVLRQAARRGKAEE